MKLYFYRGSEPNFGDELNEWLWPKLLPGFFDDDDRSLFLGVGSVLYDRMPAHATKVVCGSGYGGYTPPPVIDGSWRVYFVRGPRTASALGIDARLGIGDAGMLVRTLRPASTPKLHKVSYMPHHESAVIGLWPEFVAEAGLHYIDPRWPVEQILDEIQASHLMISESMHGAIVADALRVPWVPVRPLFRAHRHKWHDWADSLGMDVKFQSLAPSSVSEAVGVLRRQQKVSQGLRELNKRVGKLGSGVLRKPLLRALSRAAGAKPQLSSEATVQRAVDGMLAKLEQAKADHRPS